MTINNIKKGMIFVIITIIIVFNAVFFAKTKESHVFAGDINAAEARIIAVASGTFTYDGKTYKAYSSYVNELYTYLSQDDVDLSDAQANKVISYIYSNVLKGLESGYIYLVAEPEENNTDLEKEAPEEVKEAEEREASREASKKKAQDASDKEVEKMFRDIDEGHKDRTSNSKRKATDTDATVIMTDNSIVITDGDNETVLNVNESIIPEWIGSTLIITGISVLVINVLMFIILEIKGCMRFKYNKKNKPKKGHRTRRKIRKFCRRVLTVTTSVSVTTMLISLAIAIGLFNNDRIINNIQSSGYFRYSYTEYLTEVAERNAKAASESEEDGTEITEEEPLSYDEFLIREKKALDNMEASPLSVNRSLAPYISRMQTDMKSSLIISAILLILATIIANVCNIFMDRKRDRGIKSIAISTIIGTVITIALAVLLNILKIQDRFFIEPDYLYNFISDHMQWCVKILIIIGLFGAAVSMSLVGLYHSRRKDHN